MKNDPITERFCPSHYNFGALWDTGMVKGGKDQKAGPGCAGSYSQYLP